VIPMADAMDGTDIEIELIVLETTLVALVTSLRDEAPRAYHVTLQMLQVAHTTAIRGGHLRLAARLAEIMETVNTAPALDG
jgi:hypothetical protein